ncbi:hypothetical protein CKW47_09695 [Bordetella pertussis]|nr:hypothetical protein CKW47_09695 [Bordetella pertussis]
MARARAGIGAPHPRGAVRRAGRGARTRPPSGRATDDYVHDNPWQAISIAGVTGLLLGLLISRR